MESYNTNTKDNNENANHLRRQNKISILGVIIGFLGVVAVVVVGFKSDFFGTKKSANPCTALKERQDSITTRIEDLVKRRQISTNKDSIQTYYDFEIKFDNAELKNIKDNLKKSCPD